MAASPNPEPAVTVIVVNYNGGEHLPESLRALTTDALANDPPAEILVVDNASRDGSAEAAAEMAAAFPHVRLIRSAVNRGYAGGVNLGLAHARGRYVAALNPDMYVPPGWLRPAVAFLDSRPGVGAINPLIVLLHNPQRINAAGQDIHVTGLGFNRGLGRPLAWAGTQPQRVSGLQGGACIVRRALLEAMGGWDEHGFLYHEDVQLSWLIRLMGYDLYCLPEIHVRHDYHLTMYPEKLYLLERNRAWMLLAQVEAPALVLLAPLLALTELLMWAYCLLRGPAFLRAKAGAYRWLAGQRRQIAERKRFIRGLRRRTDWQVLRSLRWGYTWDQFLTLGRERGASRRQPAGGVPAEMRRPS